VLGAINGVNSANFDTNVGIGTTAPSTRLHVVGNGLFTGNLTVNGTLNANIGIVVDAISASQYNIGSSRVLSVSGVSPYQNSNTFAGVAAGESNKPDATGNGSDNSFFGSNAGANNTVGGSNSFFGMVAGYSNTSGKQNSFFGASSGDNSTQGSYNSFFGYGAGYGNQTGDLNSVLGFQASVLSPNLTNATAVGANAAVNQSNSLVLGSINGVNGATANTNVGIGTTTPSGILHVVGFQPPNLNATNGTKATPVLHVIGGKGGAGFFGGNGSNVLIESGDGGDGQAGPVGGSGGAGGSILLLPGAGGAGLTSGSPGAVGIGTTLPKTTLDVAGATSIRGSGTLANNLGAADLQVGYGLAPAATAGSVSRLALQPYGHTSGPWKFIARDDAAKAYLDWVYGARSVGITQDSNGFVGIGTSAPDVLLSVNGIADKPGGGSWASFSDERLKNIHGRFTPGLNAVMRLQPLRYEYKRDNALGIKSEGEHIGFSAQQVQRVIPEAVSQNDKGYLLVNNDPILWTMLNAIKEQQAQMENQQKEIQQLRQEVKRLRSAANQGRVRVRRG